MATEVTVLSYYKNPDYFQEKGIPVYMYSGNTIISGATLSLTGAVNNRVVTVGSTPTTMQGEPYLMFVDSVLQVGPMNAPTPAAYGGADYTFVVGSDVEGEYGGIELIGNQTTNARIGGITFHNEAAVQTDKMIADIYVDGIGADTANVRIDIAAADGSEMYNAYMTSVGYHYWYIGDAQKLRLSTAELTPMSDEGLNLGLAGFQWGTLYVHHIGSSSWPVEDIDVGIVVVGTSIDFDDTNTQIWIDSSGDLSFKDANAGTYTLSEISDGLNSWGTDNQIPVMNSGGDDFEYSAYLTFTGTTLTVGGGGTSSEIHLATTDTYDWFVKGTTDANLTFGYYGSTYLTLTSSGLDVEGSLTANVVYLVDTDTSIRVDSAGVMIFEDAIGGPYELSELVGGGTTNTFGSGLTENSDLSVDLTGTLTTHAYLTGDGNQDFAIGLNGLEVHDFSLYAAGIVDMNFSTTAGLKGGVGSTNLELAINGTGKRFILSSAQMLVVDNDDSQGLGYYADYSTAGIAYHGARWIPDKEYVDGAIATAVSNPIASTVCPHSTTTNIVIGDTDDVYFVIHYQAQRIMEDSSGGFTKMQSGTLYVLYNAEDGTTACSPGEGVGEDLGLTIDADSTSSGDLQLELTVSAENANDLTFEGYIVTSTGAGVGDYTHPNHSGQVTSAGDGATVVTVSAITAQTELASGLASTDELLVSDGGVLKRMDVSVIEAYMQANLSFGGGGVWEESSAGIITAITSGADLRLDASQHLEFVSANCYIYAANENNLSVYTAGSGAFLFGQTTNESRRDLNPSGNKTLDLGSSSLFWDNGYFDRVYIDDTATYIDISSGDMTFTDANSGTVSLAELVAGGGGGDSVWEESSAGVVTLVNAGSDILLSTLEYIYFENTNTSIRGGSTQLSFYTNGASRFNLGITDAILNCTNLRGNSNKTLDIGTSSVYCDDGYFDRIYIDNSACYIDVSGTEMTLTDSTGTYTLAQLYAGP